MTLQVLETVLEASESLEAMEDGRDLELREALELIEAASLEGCGAWWITTDPYGLPPAIAGRIFVFGIDRCW